MKGLLHFFPKLESIINSPVCFVEDLERPLTPNDLLLICPGSGLSPTETKTSVAIFHNRWRQVQVYADLFWKRWADEYLPIMIERQK